MLTITLQIDAPDSAAQGAKELLAMAMEPLGIVRVVEVRENVPEQAEIPGWREGTARPLSSPPRGLPQSGQRPDSSIKEGAWVPSPAAEAVTGASPYSPELAAALLELYRTGALHDPEGEALARAQIQGKEG